MANGIDRRNFITGAALAGASALAAAGFAGTALAADGSATSASGSASQSASSSKTAGSSTSVSGSDGGSWDYTADVVIVGSGMGGMCAGVEALEQGIKNVTIVEISKWTGGGASLSAGWIHMVGAGTTLESFDTYTQHTSTTDLQHKVFLGFKPLLDWLGEHEELPVSFETVEDTPTGFMTDADGNVSDWGPHLFFQKLQGIFEDLGGKVMTQTAGQHIIMDASGTTVEGLQCRTSDGAIVRIKVPVVILACGDFKGDDELKVRYLGTEANFAGIIGTPYNTGSGMKMATEIGASLQGAMGQWSGGFIASLPGKDWYADREIYESTDYDDSEGGKLWLYETIINSLATSDSIWVDCDGKRFCNETIRIEQEKIMNLKQASLVAVFDSTGWDTWMGAATSSVAPSTQDQIDLITSDKVGGSVLQADTIEELADALNATGITACKMHKANLVATVDEYNSAAADGTGDDLTPARPADRCAALVTPPYYAFPLRVAIYDNWGGVAIDANTQVLDLNREPIPGLYACFPTAGGIMNEVYTGDNASAGITGRIAADNAAVYLGYASADSVPSASYTESAVSGSTSASVSDSKSASGSASASGTASGSASASTSVATGSYKDGTYTGTGTGMGGKINVTLEISGGKITVTDISPNNETKGIGGYEAIEDGTFKSQIEAAQSADIEGVSGASVTSAAIKKAVQAALDQAAA